jgi:prepilin-type N-terminal cleavage/methylation domain-containing protein
MMIYKRSKTNSGFTLIELITVIAIIGILIAIAVPKFSNLFDRAKITADQATVRTLNTSTQMLRLVTASVSDPFEDINNTNDDLMEELVSGGYIGLSVSPQTKDAEFTWLFDEEKWYLLFEDSFYAIQLSDGFILEVRGGVVYLIKDGEYLAESKDIVIPASIDGTSIDRLYQDLFNGVGLVSVSFEEGSQLTRIHARAFQGNYLTTIDFPDSLTRIDYGAFLNNQLTEITLPQNFDIIEGGAFKGNDLTKITIGPNVSTIGSGAFGENTGNFTEAYDTGGAGTYLFDDGKWIKQ